MKYRRLYHDAEGESHWAEVPVEMRPTTFAPPSPKIGLSKFNNASRYAFLRFPEGWEGKWHTSPEKQMLIIISGELEIEASDGVAHRFPTGYAVMLEDTEGKGHLTRVVGNFAVLGAVLRFANKPT